MPKPLKILYVCAEAAPLAKTGGLADVSNGLPGMLRARGHDVRIAMPCYGTIPGKWRGETVCRCEVQLGQDTVHGAMRESVLPDTDVPIYLIEHDGYFDREHLYGPPGGDYKDNLDRFSFFCLATLEGIPQTGWMPDIVHCHDWHTALVPAYIRTLDTISPVWRDVRTVLTIHNLAYQGQFPASSLPRTGLRSDLFTTGLVESFGGLNLMKAGISFADKITAVSETYADEIRTPELGYGLDVELCARGADVSGIRNGVDYRSWGPTFSGLVAQTYSADNLSGKDRCKQALQEEVHFPVSTAPLFSLVARMVWEKGIGLLGKGLEPFFDRDIQIVIHGEGDQYHEMAAASLVRSHRDKVRAVLQYDESFAHRVFAGSDFFLMPSQREPCGLSQMYALAYGAVPVVRKTGGLVDTVCDATPEAVRDGQATGIVFEEDSADALAQAVLRALAIYERPDELRALRKAGMKADFSWDHPYEQYLDLYREALAMNGDES